MPRPTDPPQSQASPVDRVFAVPSPVAGVARQSPQLEFVHCGQVHYVTSQRPAADSPLGPEAVHLVCGACPVPRRGLEMRCHCCGQPLRVREQGGRLLAPIPGGGG